MLFSVEQAFVGRDETRAPLKTPAWEANLGSASDLLGCKGNFLQPMRSTSYLHLGSGTSSVWNFFI